MRPSKEAFKLGFGAYCCASLCTARDTQRGPPACGSTRVRCRLVAPPICEENPSVLESFSAIGHGMQNTAQFDVTGHPALSVPCGTSLGLPVGAMLIGRHFEEGLLYRLARGVFDEGIRAISGGKTL